MKVASGGVEVEKCPHMSDEALAKLSEATAPLMRGVKVGSGTSEYELGAETVLFRHEKTLVNNGKSHFLYAYYNVSKLNVSVNGFVDRLVHLPGEESQTALLEVTVLDDIVDVTNNVNITVESSDSSVVVVDGLTLKIADNADGVATIKILIDGVEYEKFNVTAIDYDGLGYKTVSTKAEFLAMQGTEKYVLINDIKIDGWLAKADYTPLINKLEEDAVIDGNCHFVTGGKLPG
jgi:hypothetical protein